MRLPLLLLLAGIVGACGSAPLSPTPTSGGATLPLTVRVVVFGSSVPVPGGRVLVAGLASCNGPTDRPTACLVVPGAPVTVTATAPGYAPLSDVFVPMVETTVTLHLRPIS